MTGTDKYILQNLENYNKQLIYNYKDIFIKYIEMMNNYLILCIQNIEIQNEIYKKYVIQKGAEIIEHIFNFLLFYTLNPDLSYYHSEQGFIYYIEFIRQMNINGEHSSLPLNTKDALLFVLKKTIFEINKEYRDINVITPEDMTYLNSIKCLTIIYKSLLCIYINEFKMNPDKNINAYELKSLTNIMNNIICNEFVDDNEVFLFQNHLNIVEYFMNYINMNERLSLYNKLNTIELFVKKMNKQPISIQLLQTKLYNDININDLLNNYSVNNINKFMNILFN